MERKDDDYVVVFEQSGGYPMPAVRQLKVIVSANDAEDAISKAKKELNLASVWNVTRVCSVIITQVFAKPDQA
jgi:hypothetical protein